MIPDLYHFVSKELSSRRNRLPQTHPAAQMPGPVNASIIEDLRAALLFIDADPYDIWFRTLIALKTLGESGRELAREWSARSEKHTDEEFNEKWAGLIPEQTSYKAIFTEAASNGWHNSGYSQNVPLVDISALLKPMNEQAYTSRYRLLSDLDFEAIPSMQWRIKNVLPAQGLVAIYGASRNGKSFLAFDMACAIASGQGWFGYRVKTAYVLYIGLEGEAGYKGRVLAWKHHNRHPLPDNLRVILQSFYLTDPQDVQDLAAIAPKGGVIFIDTMNRAAPTADENSSKDMGSIIEGTKHLQQLTGGLIVLIAHTGKDSTKGLRGHSSLFAALDGAICVNRLNESESRSWKIDKSKDGKDGGEHGFRLEVIEIEKDEDGDSVTSCVVMPDDTFKRLQSRVKPLTQSQKIGMESFREAVQLNGVLNEKGRFAGIHRDLWRPIFYRKYPAEDDAAKRKQFNRVTKELINLNQLSYDDNIYRLANTHALIEEQIITKVLHEKRDM